MDKSYSPKGSTAPFVDANTAIFISLDKTDLVNKAHMNDTIHIIDYLVNVGGSPRHSLTFNGYNNDPRDVWNIPECVAFCKRVMIEVPRFLRLVDVSTFRVLLLSTAVHVNGEWRVNSAWASVLPDYQRYTISRK